MKKIGNDVLLAIIVATLAISVLVVSFITGKNNKKTNNIEIVTNYNDFYTVDSCIYRIITYINSNNNDNLLLVLNDKYKKENNITGISDLMLDIPDNGSFISKKMYYENINDNVKKYYVYGYILPNIMDLDTTEAKEEQKEIYFIVYMDEKNLTFSFEPYDGKVFIGGELDE